MSFFRAMDIAASGMSVERFQMDLISGNIANAGTTKTKDGDPYRRQFAVRSTIEQPEFSLAGLTGDDEAYASGVELAGVVKDNSEFKYVWDPDHPNAQKKGQWKGYVAMPNINIVEEMSNLMLASRAYEANSSIIEASKNMAMKALDMGRG
jgi:flagellar basal-body rod protein FlgC